MRMTMDAGLGDRPAMMARWIGRGAAPARQQGGVQVETAEARRVEHRLRQEKPVGDDDRGIEIERGEGPLFGLAFQRGGREDRNAVFLGEAMHRRQLFGHAATGLARRLRIDRDDLVAARRELVSSTGTEKSGVPMKARRNLSIARLRRAGAQAGSFSCSFFCLISFFSIIERLTRERWSMKRMPFR